MNVPRCFLSSVFMLPLVGFAAPAQATTGAPTGEVTTDGIGLPGATIAISSPHLQGTRSTVCDTNASLPRVRG